MLRDIWGGYFFLLFVYACVGCVPVGEWEPKEDGRSPALSLSGLFL